MDTTIGQKLQQKRLNHHKLLLAVVLFFHTLFSTCQTVEFKKFDTKNGLPSNEVYHMFQDVNGYIWFATDHCISRYDGNTFENFGLQDGLTSNTILRFYPQKNGDVWCSTINNKFFFFNPNECNFIAYKYNDVLSKAAKDGVNDDLLLEEDGTLHVGFIDKVGIISVGPNGTLINQFEVEQLVYNSFSIVLEVLPNGESLAYLGSKPTIKKLKGSKILHIEQASKYYHKADARGDISLLADMNDLYLFKSGKRIKKISSEERIIGLGFIGNDRFWVGKMYGGITLYDLNGNEIETYLDGESVSCLIIDHEGGTWISTISSGVYYSSNREIKQFQFAPSTYVHGLSLDRNNNLFATLYDGSIYEYSMGQYHFSQSSSYKGPSQLHYYSGVKAEVLYVNYILKINDTIVMPAFVRKFSEEESQPPLFVGKERFLKWDKGKVDIFPVNGNLRDACFGNNQVYLALDDGLYTYDLIGKSQKRVTNPMFNCRVSDIDVWRTNLIVATYGNGVGIIKDDKIFSITMEDGLTSNIVREVYVQNDSTIWACTNAGINRIIIGENLSFDISTFSYQDGLVDNAVTDVEVIDDVVWVATRSGISAFPVSVMDNESRAKNYFLRLLNVKVNGQPDVPLESLGYWENKLEFNYQAISFKGKESLGYRYKLVGLDKHWNYTTSRKVVYEALAPGEYTFILQVGSKNQWSAEKIVVPIVISPAYYETAWFKLLITSIIVLLIYLFFKLRVLVYNRDLTRELLRHLLKRLKRKSDYFVVRESGRDVRISSSNVLFVKSLGNYLEIYTSKGKVVTREKISHFLTIIPDPLEYIQVRRSYIARIDKIDKKGHNSIFIEDHEIKIGKTFPDVLSGISLR